MTKDIHNIIYTIRGEKVILDRDLASLYGWETKYLNKQIKRNNDFFSNEDYFQLEKDELETLWFQIGTANKEINLSKKSRVLPTFFTKTGIEKLSIILKKDGVSELNKIIITEIEKVSQAMIFPQSELKNEVLTYISEDGQVSFDVKIDDETVWLTQQQMADLFDTSQQNVSLHMNNIFDEKELTKNSVHKEYLYTALDGKQYKTSHYDLKAIIAVGFRINSKRGSQFRIWANGVLEGYFHNGGVIKKTATPAQIERLINELEAQKTEISELKDLMMSQPANPSIVSNSGFIKHLIEQQRAHEKDPNESGLRLMIFCEGKTDIAYLQKALTLFGYEKEELDKQVKFFDGNGTENLKHIKYTYENELMTTVMNTSLFVFDCDVKGLDMTQKKGVISYQFPRQEKAKGYVYQAGIENNFHRSVYEDIFKAKQTWIELILKRYRDTNKEITEDLINVGFNGKTELCKWLCEEGTKEAFSNFRAIVSLIAELAELTHTKNLAETKTPST